MWVVKGLHLSGNQIRGEGKQKERRKCENWPHCILAFLKKHFHWKLTKTARWMGKISTEDCNEERSIGLSERFRESFIIIPFLRTKIFQLITWFTYVTGFRIHQGRFREDLLKLCDMTLTCRKATPHLFLFKETFIDMNSRNSSKMANEVLDTFYCSCGQDFEHDKS